MESHPFIPNKKQWKYICNWTPRCRGKDQVLEQELRYRLSFSEPWKDILNIKYRWTDYERFQRNEVGFVRMHMIVKDWLEKETEQAMWSLVWSGYETGGPEIFQQELHVLIYYGISNMYTDRVATVLRNSIFAKEWKECYDRGEIANDVFYR
jgi:hypothetical protein